MKRSGRAAAWVAMLTVSGALCAAAWQPLDQPGETAATLNAAAMAGLREGRWTESLAQARRAEALAEQAGDMAARAEAAYLVAAALVRLKDAGAREAVERAETLVKDVPAGHWIHGELPRLKAELAGGGGRPAAGGAGQGAGRDLGLLLWQMREAASQGRWPETAERAEGILAREGLGDGVRADALLHRYAAERALARPGAEATLREFEAAAGRLSDPGMSARMRLLRESLGDAVEAGPAAAVFSPGPDAYWKVVDPGTAGMDAAVLEAHVAMARASGADGVLVAKGDRIVSEWYSPLYREPIATMSSVKSITGLLAGLLVAEGKLAVDDPVSKFLPEWADGPRAGVTVRHLLTMTAGLPKRRDVGVGAAGPEGMNAYVRGLAPEWEPGTKWAYSNEGAQLLSPVLEAAAGEPLWRYAESRLFAPMGLTETQMKRDGVGGTSTYADARTTLREMAKFGALALNKGAWEGKQVVPESWIVEMTGPCPQHAGYGYLWWLHESPKVWSMQGYLNTSVWVFPELGVVVARCQREPYLHAKEAYDPRAMFGLIERAARP